MRRHPDYLLRHAADTDLIVPVGRAAAKFPGMITVNGTGRFLWERLSAEQTADSLTEALCETYDVTREQARADVETFLRRLRLAGALLEPGSPAEGGES